MARFFLVAIVFSLGCLKAAAAPCITQQNGFPGYVQALAADAERNGIGRRGLRALTATQLSGITWRFETNPKSQTGTLRSDPAQFLAKRSGSSAAAFIDATARRIQRNAPLFAAIEERYGVPGSVLATIWWLETSWGGYLGRTPIVSGAVTLASSRNHRPDGPKASHALTITPDQSDRAAQHPDRPLALSDVQEIGTFDLGRAIQRGASR